MEKVLEVFRREQVSVTDGFLVINEKGTYNRAAGYAPKIPGKPEEG